MNKKIVSELEANLIKLENYLKNLFKKLKKERKLTQFIKEKDPGAHLQNYSQFALDKQNWKYEKIIETAKKVLD